MTGKKYFDYNREMLSCFSNNIGENAPEICLSSYYDAVYSIVLKAPNKQVDVVCFESDFIKFGKELTKAVKDAEGDASTLLIEDKDFCHTHTKGFFSFTNKTVIVLGSASLLCLTAYYATIQNATCHAILTDANFGSVLSNKMKIFIDGIPVALDVNPFKTVVCDINIISKASKESFALSFITVISKFITLIDYKLRVFTDSIKFDKANYELVKSAISLVAGINGYSNYKEVLVYSQAVVAKVVASSNVLEDGSVELFSDTLGIFAPDFSAGDRILLAFSKLIAIYHMFFNNDFSDLVSVPDYNADIALLEKSTGKTGGYFRKNLKIPSDRRRVLINKLLDKTKSGFLKETSLLLEVLSPIKKIYNSLDKCNEKGVINYEMIKNSLLLCTYFSNKTSVLSLIRDMGILKCID